MKYFGSNIKIDGDDLIAFVVQLSGPEKEQSGRVTADLYERQVWGLLCHDISRRETGKVLLKAINRLGARTVTIKPEVELPSYEYNAEAIADNVIDGTKKGKSIFERERNLEVGSENSSGWGKPKRRGTGLGSNTTIRFTANYYINNEIRKVINLEPPPGKLADAVLVHELAHALRWMAGLTASKPVPFQKMYRKVKHAGYKRTDSYPDWEEWFAVLIENLYRSECRQMLRAGYRSSYGNFTDEQFIGLGMNRAHMRQFRREHRDFFSDLRDIEIPFNPTRLILDL